VRGGHSTFRLIVDEKQAGSPFEERFRELEELGCGYEGSSATFVAVDVPPGASAVRVYELLEAGEADGIWRFEEAHVERS
jgi:hypothetical protein